MIDRVSTVARLTRRRAIVAHRPDWTIEILIGLVVTLGIALLATLGQLAGALNDKREAIEERQFWQEFALAPDVRARVVLEPDGNEFKCQHFNVRREWESAVAAECAVLGGLLQMAHYSDQLAHRQ